MSDLLGVMNSPDGDTIKIVVSTSEALDGRTVVGFPTLTSNVIIALNIDAVREAASHHDQVEDVLMPFMAEIIEAAQTAILAHADDPFGLDKSNQEGDLP
jgi:hypothetical protein